MRFYVPEFGYPSQVEVLGHEDGSVVPVNDLVEEEMSAACLESMLKQKYGWTK
jgi:hypothetical protein